MTEVRGWKENKWETESFLEDECWKVMTLGEGSEPGVEELRQGWPQGHRCGMDQRRRGNLSGWRAWDLYIVVECVRVRGC